MTDEALDLTTPEAVAAIKAASDAAVAEATAGLLSKRDELLGELKTARATNVQFKDVDLEKYQAMVTASAAAETAEAERKGEWTKLKDNLTDAHMAALKSKDESITRLATSLETHLVESQLATEIAKSKGIPELLAPALRQSVRAIQNEDGSYSTRVVTPSGEVRLNADANPMTVHELVTEFKADAIYSRAFGAENSGGGAGGGVNGTGGTRDALLEQLTVAAKANNIEEYKKLKEKISAL